jgi:small GTP-binding protein
MSKNSREDEEERMAADAEKRKRMLAANHQASSSSNEPFKRFKLLLLGDSAVGKSSLILRWTMDTFSPNLTSTVGVNFKSKKVQCFGEWIQVQVWDTSGQENFHKITTSYYRGAQGIMLVYDVTEKKSFENVAYWIKNIKAHASDSVQIVLVGNKIDLRDSAPDATGMVTTEMGRQVAQKFGVPFFETSAKAANYVEDAFMTLVAAIANSNASGTTKSIPGSPTPSAAVGGSNNSPLMSHPGSSGSNNSINTSVGSGQSNPNNQSPPPDGAKRSFFSALRRRSSGGGGSIGSPDHSSSGGSANGNSSTTSSDGGPHPHGSGEGLDGDKEKCVIS